MKKVSHFFLFTVVFLVFAALSIIPVKAVCTLCDPPGGCLSCSGNDKCVLGIVNGVTCYVCKCIPGECGCPTATPTEPWQGPFPTPTSAPGVATATPQPGVPGTPTATPTANPACRFGVTSVTLGENASGDCETSCSTITHSGDNCIYTGELVPCPNATCPTSWRPCGWSCTKTCPYCHNYSRGGCDCDPATGYPRCTGKTGENTTTCGSSLPASYFCACPNVGQCDYRWDGDCYPDCGVTRNCKDKRPTSTPTSTPVPCLINDPISVTPYQTCGSSSYNIGWTASDAFEADNIRIRKHDGTSWSQIGMVATNTTSFDTASLAPDGYNFEVCCYKGTTAYGCRQAGGSNPACTPTPTPCPRPNTPDQSGPARFINYNQPTFYITDRGSVCYPHHTIYAIRYDYNGNGNYDDGDIIVHSPNPAPRHDGIFSQANQSDWYTMGVALNDGWYIWRGWTQNTDPHAGSAETTNDPPNSWEGFCVDTVSPIVAASLDCDGLTAIDYDCSGAKTIYYYWDDGHYVGSSVDAPCPGTGPIAVEPGGSGEVLYFFAEDCAGNQASGQCVMATPTPTNTPTPVPPTATPTPTNTPTPVPPTATPTPFYKTCFYGSDTPQCISVPGDESNECTIADDCEICGSCTSDPWKDPISPPNCNLCDGADKAADGYEKCLGLDGITECLLGVYCTDYCCRPPYNCCDPATSSCQSSFSLPGCSTGQSCCQSCPTFTPTPIATVTPTLVPVCEQLPATLTDVAVSSGTAACTSDSQPTWFWQATAGNQDPCQISGNQIGSSWPWSLGVPGQPVNWDSNEESYSYTLGDEGSTPGSLGTGGYGFVARQQNQQGWGTYNWSIVSIDTTPPITTASSCSNLTASDSGCGGVKRICYRWDNNSVWSGTCISSSSTTVSGSGSVLYYAAEDTVGNRETVKSCLPPTTPTPGQCQVTSVEADALSDSRVCVDWSHENCQEADKFYLWRTDGGWSNEVGPRGACGSWSVCNSGLECNTDYTYCVGCKKDGNVYNSQCDTTETFACLTPQPSTPTPTPSTTVFYPNLKITDITCSEGNSTISYTITNDGDTNVIQSSYTWLYIDDQYIEEQSIGGLAVNGTRTHTFSHFWNCSDVNDLIEVYIDATDLITEKDEGDNHHGETLTCSPPTIPPSPTPTLPPANSLYGYVFYDLKNDGHDLSDPGICADTCFIVCDDDSRYPENGCVKVEVGDDTVNNEYGYACFSNNRQSKRGYYVINSGYLVPGDPPKYVTRKAKLVIRKNSFGPPGAQCNFWPPASEWLPDHTMIEDIRFTKYSGEYILNNFPFQRVTPTPTPTPTPTRTGTSTPTPTKTPTPTPPCPNCPDNRLGVPYLDLGGDPNTEYHAALSWDDVSDETNYRIYRDEVLIATLESDETSYDDEADLSCDTSYQYQINPWKSGCTEPSCSLTVTTGPCCPQCAKPTVNAVFDIDGLDEDDDWNDDHTVIVDWSPVLYADGYDIYRNGTLIETVNEPVASYTYEDTGLYCETDFQYEVRPFRAHCTTPLSCTPADPVTTDQCFGILEGHVWEEGLNTGSAVGIPADQDGDGDSCATDRASIVFPRFGSPGGVQAQLADYIIGSDNDIGLSCGRYALYNILPGAGNKAEIIVNSPEDYKIVYYRKNDVGGMGEGFFNKKHEKLKSRTFEIEFGSPEILDVSVQDDVAPWFTVVNGDVGAKGEFYSKLPDDQEYLIDGGDAALIAPAIGGVDRVSENEDWRVESHGDSGYITNLDNIYDELDASLLKNGYEEIDHTSSPLPVIADDEKGFAHVFLRDGDYQPATTTYQSGESMIIVVRGDLIIDQDVIGPDDSASGVIFIVKDDVKVNYQVERIDALIYFGGEFTDIEGITADDIPLPLIINGGLIGPSAGAFTKGFGRDLGPIGNNTNPAETVVYKPKYLTMFIDQLGERIYTQKEVAPSIDE